MGVYICLAAAILLFALARLPWVLTASPSRWTRSRKDDKEWRRSYIFDFSNTFPPSRRHLLPQVVKQVVPSAAAEDNTEHRPPEKPYSTLEMHSDHRLADSARPLFSGFTVGEVRSLGDFPDYAKLSGVPLPSPATGFNIDTALPRPYRPFRWPYHQTMSLQKLDPDYWLELESTYRERIHQRRQLFAQYGSDILQALPGSELACKELMEMVLQFLCARYPQCFELSDEHTFVNRILGTTHDLKKTEPLHILLDNIPEDFALVLRDHVSGKYYFRAGIICSAIGWNLGEKIGLSMSDIHQPVPEFREKVAFSVDRFFAKLATDRPIQRASWGFEVGQPLYLPYEHSDFRNRETQSPNLDPADIFLRVDWQTLRRLPLSGAVAFNFKALFTPVSEFQGEPYVPSLVLKVLNEGNRGILKYKGTWHVEHVLKPALEAYERQQVQTGLIESQWIPHTLDESPFFPGWERKSCKAEAPVSYSSAVNSEAM